MVDRALAVKTEGAKGVNRLLVGAEVAAIVVGLALLGAATVRRRRTTTTAAGTA
jgi:hypothetical protein